MGEVINFPDKKNEEQIDERILTPEIMHEYTSTIMLVDVYKDQLNIEDWKRAYGMMLNFNYLLMKYIGRCKINSICPQFILNLRYQKLLCGFF